MKYNSLGRSELSVSEIGFGCMSLEPGVSENQSVVDLAISQGINFFDTADLYNQGDNEIELGKLIGRRRKNLVLATKVGNKLRSGGNGWDWDASRDYIIGAVEESLRRLNTDYIDLYQLHGGTIEDNIPETIDAFETLVKQGKIRYYGISSIRPEVIRRWIDLSNISTVMMQYSLLDRRPEETVIELLKENKVSMLARGALARGVLAGKPAKEFLSYSPEEAEQAAEAIRSLDVGTSLDLDEVKSADVRTSAAKAIRFVLHNSVVASAVVGMRTVQQGKEAASAGDIEKLRDDELEILRASIKPNFYTDYR